ncbi:hypothetical protein T06_1295 [Trichinella sp. T6]|nr:hypothetical protein T06_1295 [Trichinella sp. T6]
MKQGIKGMPADASLNYLTFCYLLGKAVCACLCPMVYCGGKIASISVLAEGDVEMKCATVNNKEQIFDR